MERCSEAAVEQIISSKLITVERPIAELNWRDFANSMKINGFVILGKLNLNFVFFITLSQLCDWTWQLGHTSIIYFPHYLDYYIFIYS